jgi:BTB/POZ domain
VTYPRHHESQHQNVLQPTNTFIITMDRIPISLNRPPARASQHGNDTVMIKAGQGERNQTFTIHKDLLCRSSGFFVSVFNGRFLESETGCLDFPEVDPMTLEVLYQWLYTGSTDCIPGFAAESDVGLDLLWLRVLTMAHQYMIDALQEIAFYRFGKTLHEVHPVVPSLTCIEEVYDSDLPTNLVDMLKSYLVLHSAYWITDGSSNCWNWESVLQHPRFGADVAWELTKRASKHYVGVFSHPKYNLKFASYKGRVFLKSDVDEEATL